MLNWTAIILSLKLAAIVSLLLLLIALPVAYWIAFSSRRWKFLVEAIVAMPLVLPLTVLGFYILVAICLRSPAGGLYEHVTGQRLLFSFSRFVFPSLLYCLHFGVQQIAY